MKKLTLAGAEYICPFAESFRPHSQVELDDMIDSLLKYGLQSPILTYFDTDLQAKCILDGLGRLAVASQVENVQIDVKDLGSKSTNEAFELAKVHNDHRRHDDPAAILKRKEERLQRVAELRSEGKSIRDIAKTVDVSKTQVQRYVDEVSRTGQLPFPEVVIGEDGKKHPSKKKSSGRSQAVKTAKSSKRKGKTRDPKSDDAGNDEPETIPAQPAGKLATYYKNDGLDEQEGVYRPRFTKASNGQEVVLDALGRPCPAGLGDTFAETKLRKLVLDFTSLCDDAEQLRKHFTELKERREEHQCYTWANITTITGHIDKARDEIVKATNELRDAIPYVVCPKCHGERKGCRDCKSTGYWPRHEYEFKQDDFKKNEAA